MDRNSYWRIFHLSITPSAQRQNRFGWIQFEIRPLEFFRTEMPLLAAPSGTARHRSSNGTETFAQERLGCRWTSFYIFFIRNSPSHSLARSISNISAKKHLQLFRLALSCEWEIFLWDLLELCISPSATAIHIQYFPFPSFMHCEATVSA